MRKFARQPFYFYIGIVILGFFLILAVFADVLVPHDPWEMGIPFQPPNREHLFGTNDIGQDIASEIIYGARISLTIGLVTSFIVTFVGGTLGMVAGYLRGMPDKIINTVINIFMTIPDLPLTIVLVAFLGSSIWNIIFVICITAWTGTARVVRSRVLQIREMPYIKIEKTFGIGSITIMFKHILPNISKLVFIRGALAVAWAMLTEASLSFLGLGTYAQKSWGMIIHHAFFRNGVMAGYWWWYIPPIVCISLSILGFVFLGYFGENTSGTIPALSGNAIKNRRVQKAG